jgi:putative transposase
MPEHVHLLLTPAPGVTLERSIQLVKARSSHALGLELSGKGEVWQRGFTDHRIRDSEDFENHRSYVHEKSVKRGLAMFASEYRYCSAFPGFKLDSWPSAAEAA